MTTTAAIETRCPGAPDGHHVMLSYAGGEGCDACSLWVMRTGDRVVTTEPLPSDGAPALNTGETRTIRAALAVEHIEDLPLEVADRLLPILANDVSLTELLIVADQVIALVRGHDAQ